MGRLIENLPSDIYKLLEEGLSESSPVLEEFGKRIAEMMKTRLVREERKPSLRMSNIGSPCSRKLWFEINQPETREKLDGKTLLKFLYGDLIEEIVLLLAELSGHDVKGRQDKMSLAGIEGHRDAVIDGYTVDVKSASSFSYKKFKDKTLDQDDPFGYMIQLQSYMASAQDDETVTNKDKGYFIAVNKEDGDICTLPIKAEKLEILTEGFEKRKAKVALSEPPKRPFDPVKDGESGNEKLPTVCSYCSVKKACHPNLRVFDYAGKPRYLTTVKRVPNVPEIT